MFRVLLLSIIASYVAAAPPLVFDCANMPGKLPFRIYNMERL